MRKSFYYLLLILLIAFAFVGCGNESPKVSTKDETLKTNETTSKSKNDNKSSGLPSSSSPNYSYFDDAVFVGDSVSLKLSYYVNSMRKGDPNFMGKAKFLVSGSLGSGNALWKISDKSVHPSYKGEKMLIEDSILKMNVKKVYIMLGINDVAIYGVEGSIKNMEKLIDNIKEKSPDVKFYIQSATPIAKGCEKGNLTNNTLNKYNKSLKEFSQSKGYTFIDIASTIKDGEGFLPRDYCSDPDGMGVHFKDNVCEIWTDLLFKSSAN